MTKTKIKTVMEMKNVSYIEKPYAILKFKREGFSLDDIQITRIDSSHYNMTAIKYC